uniref:Peptidase S33 tripeptidyl aminopeptidase-like C-terminal domain-containing protein n=1 Tax=Globisporangium ultimum (strain ATCC 200006 / CBS 805.95 / DAOM BR144) TaxID=431595 RepID=K3XAS0_GLOUD
MASLYEELKGNVNVYTMDHRGTGRSTLLDCVAAQATMSASPSGGDIDVKEVGSCAEELEIKFGKDLSAFSITSAATDIKTFITQFMAGSKTFVYGVSYGSALVERLMHLQTTEIIGYILDGVSTTSGADAKDGMYITNWDTNFGEVGDRFLAFCASDATCASRFSSLSIQDTLKKLSATNNGPCTSFSTYEQITSLRALVGIMLMSAQTRSLIAPLLYRLNRCDYELWDSALSFSLIRDDSPLNQASEEAAFASTLLYYLIVFSEMWETPTPSYNMLQSRFDNVSISSGPISAMHAQYCAFTKDNSTGCAKSTLYAASPIAYKKDKYWNVAATIPAQASVLIMSGKLDPQTPHKYAKRLFKVLNGTKKELVAFEYASHGTLFSTYVSDTAAASGAPTCGMSVLASYVANGGDLTKLDTSCVASLHLHFEPSPAVSKVLFHTSDAYDGKFVFDDEEDYNYETEYKYRTPFIVMMIALAVLLLIAAGLCFRCQRRKSAEKAKTASATTTRTDRREHDSANATERMDSGVAASPSATAGVYTAVEESRV